MAGALAAVVQSGEEKVPAEELDFRLASNAPLSIYSASPSAVITNIAQFVGVGVAYQLCSIIAWAEPLRVRDKRSC